MRWNTQLKDIYSYYSTIGEDFDPNNFTMRASQLWMLAKDCGLLSQSINITRINRIVTEVRLQLAQAVALSRRRREAAEKGVPVDLATPIDDRAYMEVEEDIHSPTRPILFREFVEALVRIANEREAVPESAGEASAAPTAAGAAAALSASGLSTLQAKLAALLDVRVKDNAATTKAPRTAAADDTSDAIRKALGEAEMKQWLAEVNVELRRIFVEYGHSGPAGRADITLYTKELALMLRNSKVVGSSSSPDAATISVTESTQAFLQHALEEALIHLMMIRTLIRRCSFTNLWKRWRGSPCSGPAAGQRLQQGQRQRQRQRKPKRAKKALAKKVKMEKEKHLARGPR